MRKSKRLALLKAQEAEESLKNFLEESGYGRCTTGNGDIVLLGHVGPKSSYMMELKLEDIVEWCLELCKENMEKLYDRVWGWDDEEKRQQFQLEGGHFFVGFENGNRSEPIGYCQVVLETYNDQLVLYLYELHIEKRWRRRGIGEHLMSTVEALGKQLNVDGIVLTCMQNNDLALKFYDRLGFCLDPTSPDSGNKYVILSKQLEKMKTTE